MFGNNSDLVPMTYSIKSYRRRGSSFLKKLFAYVAYTLIVAAVLGIVFLSVTRLI